MHGHSTTDTLAIDGGWRSEMLQWCTEFRRFLVGPWREPDAVSLFERIEAFSVLAELIGMVEAGDVSASAAKDVLVGVMAGEGKPRQVAEARDLIQISDTGAIEAIVDQVLAENADAVERYQAGEHKVVGFLVGQVMRASAGKVAAVISSRLVEPSASASWASTERSAASRPARKSASDSGRARPGASAAAICMP